MPKININKVNKKYIDMAKDLKNIDIHDPLVPDSYISFDAKMNYVDHGYIKAHDGVMHNMFIATSVPDEYTVASLYFSYDGAEWHQISMPNNEVTAVYNKIIIYRGNVYFINDDEVKCLSDFNFNDETMTVTNVLSDIYDGIVIDNTLYLLSNNGVYKVLDSEPEFIGITGDFPFERFVPNLHHFNNEIIIMGYAGNYPMFVVYDGATHLVLCTCECKVKSAICIDDKIYCYTDNSKIVVVDKVYNVLEPSSTIYDGHPWSGIVTYHHSYFWITYTELNGSDGNYTVVAKSSNGINFDADTKLPYMTDSLCSLMWGKNSNHCHTLCVCAGDIYVLTTSVNYYNYGYNTLIYKEVDLVDEHVSIPIDFKLSDINIYNISVFLCNKDSQTYQSKILSYKDIPHINDDNIEFTLTDGDYSDKYIALTLCGTDMTW